MVSLGNQLYVVGGMGSLDRRGLLSRNTVSFFRIDLTSAQGGHLFRAVRVVTNLSYRFNSDETHAGVCHSASSSDVPPSPCFSYSICDNALLYHSIPCSRRDCSLFLHNNSLLLYGGSSSAPDAPLNDLWRYDPASSTWTLCSQPDYTAPPHPHEQACYLDGVVYTVGGWACVGGVTSSLQSLSCTACAVASFQINSQTWRVSSVVTLCCCRDGQNIMQPVVNHACVAIHSGPVTRMLVVGGQQPSLLAREKLCAAPLFQWVPIPVHTPLL